MSSSLNTLAGERGSVPPPFLLALEADESGAPEVNSSRHAAAFYRGVELINRGQFADAIDAFEEAIEFKPRLWEAHYNLGCAYYRIDQFPRAIVAFRRAFTLNPNHANAGNNLALTLGKSGQFQKAIGVFRETLKRSPGHAATLADLGAALLETGKTEAAIGYLQKAIDAFEKAPEPTLQANAHNELGRALRTLGKLEEAVKYFRNAIALDCNHQPALVNLGSISADTGDFATGIDAYRRYLALRPDDAIAHSNLSHRLRMTGQFGDAVGEAKKALALMPELAVAHLNLGVALEGNRQFAEAIDAYREYLALKPDDGLIHSNLSNLLNAAGQFGEGFDEANKALALIPNFAQAHFNLGMALFGKGQFAEAVAVWRRTSALALTPEMAQGLTRFIDLALKRQRENNSYGTNKPAYNRPATPSTTDTTLDTATKNEIASRELRAPVDVPEWPRERWENSVERGFRKRGALVDYLRDVWKPFIQRTNALVTTEILAGVDRPLARAILSYERSQPLPDDIGIVSSKKLKAHSATRPALSRSGLLVPHS